MKDRSGVVIIENKKVALIQRVRAGVTYYVFPGGGIERNETPQMAAKREAFEELGVEVEVKECLCEVPFNGTQYYFLADIRSGVFGTGQGEEFSEETNVSGSYVPMWVDIETVHALDVRPTEVAVMLKSIAEGD